MDSLQFNFPCISRSVECTIACYERAVGDCAEEGIFRLYDFAAYRVGMRYSCNYDITGTVFYTMAMHREQSIVELQWLEHTMDVSNSFLSPFEKKSHSCKTGTFYGDFLF